MALINRTHAAPMLGISIYALNSLIYKYRCVAFPKQTGIEKNGKVTTKLYEESDILAWYKKVKAYQLSIGLKPAPGLNNELARSFIIKSDVLTMSRLAAKHGKRGITTTVHVPERNDYYPPRNDNLYNGGRDHRLTLDQTRY